ncbi:MAG: hypothetical protein R3D55_19715 [Chloroflexota bacterium]
MGNFSALILILLALAFFLRVDFIFYVIYVSVGIYAWGRWLMPRAMKNLKSRRVYDRQAFWGEVVPVTIELSNHGRLPIPWVQVQESVAIQLKHGEPLHQVVALNRGKRPNSTTRSLPAAEVTTSLARCAWPRATCLASTRSRLAFCPPITSPFTRTLHR